MESTDREDQASSVGGDPPLGLLCEICQARQRQYKCPRCGVFTCSLECCKRHKVQTECSGRRDRTAYVPISGFSSDNLRNDYHFLEDVLQTKDCAKRTLIHSCGGLPHRPRQVGKKRPHRGGEGDDDDDDGTGAVVVSLPLFGARAPPQQLDNHTQGVRNLVKAAAAPGREARIIVMAPGMSRRRQNTSHFRSRTDEMLWRVHAVFVIGPSRSTSPSDRLVFDPAILLRPELETSAESSVSTLHFPNDPSGLSFLVGMSLGAVHEKDTVDSLLARFLDPLPGNAVQRHALRTLRHVRPDIVCLTQHIPSPAASPIFVPIVTAGSLREALRGKTVLEYPTLVFALPEHVEHLRRFVAEEADGEAEDEPEPPAKLSKARHSDAGSSDEEEGEDGEVDEDFLAALKDLEGQDIASLKAIASASLDPNVIDLESV